jgi:hypothetical protein
MRRSRFRANSSSSTIIVRIILKSLLRKPRENTEQTEITEQTEKDRKDPENLRLFRYFRLFRTLSSSFSISVFVGIENETVVPCPAALSTRSRDDWP